MSRWRRRLTTAAALLAMSAPVQAQDSSGDLAKASQNPVGNLVSLPLQNNTSFGIGPDDAVSNVLNIQPVYPLGLSEKWNLINRAIIPVVYQEAIFPEAETLNPELATSASGLGDTSYTAFISPSKPGKLIWGVGPSLLLPTATEDRWATNKWSAGAGVVVLGMPGNWVSRAPRPECLVVRGRRRCRRRQLLPDPADHQLQPGRRLVPDVGSGHHRQLGSAERQPLDRSGRWRIRSDHQVRQATGRSVAPGLLQRRAAVA